MKNLTDRQKRCADCPSLVEYKGKWACDECFNQLCDEIDDCPEGVTLEQIETLEKKAKDNKVTLVGAKSAETKERKTRERKPDEEKEKIIADFASFIEKFAENVRITNISKVIEFDLGENHYKLDLIKQRKPKK